MHILLHWALIVAREMPQVRTALFRCLALLPHALSDAIRSMIVNTLIKAPLSVADLESSIACAGVLCKKVSSLDSLRKKLKSAGNTNNAAVMVAMARCGLDEGSPVRPLEILRALLEVPGDPSMVGVVDGIGGDAKVFGKCCCSLVWRASELGLAGEVFDFLMEDLRDREVHWRVYFDYADLLAVFRPLGLPSRG